MVPAKVWKLLGIVGCEDVYEFLGVDRSAPLEELQAAADKKHASIHNQSSRNAVTRAGGKLAELCKADIFKSARRKAAYDREADRRDPRRQAAAAEARRQALARVAAAGAAGVAHLVAYSRGISVTGFALMVSGTALMTGLGAGQELYTLGTLVFPCGFTAVLYRGSRRDTAAVALAGIALVTLGTFARPIYYSLAAQDAARYAPLLLATVSFLRMAGGLVLLSAALSFGFRQSWHVRVGAAARPFVERWLARMATTREPLIMAGATGMALALVFDLGAGAVASLLFGQHVAWTRVAQAAGGILFLGSGLVAVVGVLRNLAGR